MLHTHTHTRRTQQEQVRCNSVGKFPQPKIFLLQQYVICMQCGWCQSGLQHWPVITNAHTHTHSRNSSFLSTVGRSGSSWKPGWKSSFFECCSKFENDECSERMPIVGVVVERQTWYLHANAIVEPLFWINKYWELDRRGRLTMDVHRAAQGCENLKYQISNLKSSQNKFLTLTFQNFKTCKCEPQGSQKSNQLQNAAELMHVLCTFQVFSSNFPVGNSPAKREAKNKPSDLDCHTVKGSTYLGHKASCL